MTLSPLHLKMARHTLGLPNKTRRSCRNRYYAAAGGDAARDFDKIVAQGLAAVEPDNGSMRYYLTRAGAELALERGEELCGEDFPV